jgi:hypothetical protein
MPTTVSVRRQVFLNHNTSFPIITSVRLK